ncbi:MAG TPA: hypothetical protein VFG09_14105 [Thermodesulfovibrionales bacterium]|jgi:hypothetical protein|nr:hypothetical protein [Thermodesulfovibrionales bacterium]
MHTELITINYPVTPYVRANHDALQLSRIDQDGIVGYKKADTFPQATENESPFRRGVAFWDAASERRTTQILIERVRTSSAAEEAINAYQRVQESELRFKSRLVDLYA